LHGLPKRAQTYLPDKERLRTAKIIDLLLRLHPARGTGRSPKLRPPPQSLGLFIVIGKNIVSGPKGPF